MDCILGAFSITIFIGYSTTRTLQFAGKHTQPEATLTMVSISILIHAQSGVLYAVYNPCRRHHILLYETAILRPPSEFG